MNKGKLESSASVIEADDNDVTDHGDDPKDEKKEKKDGKQMNKLKEKRKAGIPHISIIEREAKRRQIESINKRK